MPTDYHKKMRVYRTENKISQEDMAKRMGLTQQNYSSIERGITRMSFDFAQSFKEKTGVDLLGSESAAPALPKDDLSVLKFNYDRLVKFVMEQSEEIKTIKESLRMLTGTGF